MNNSYKVGLPPRVIEFINYQSNVKNKSQLTLNEYCLDIRLFLKYLCACENCSENDLENTDISLLDDSFFKAITLQDAYKFLSYCKDERANMEKARARKTSAIRSFFKYLKMNNIIDDNPMINLDSPKLKKSLPKYLTVDQAKALLRAVDGPNRERDYCIITFFLNCGIRLSELVSMNYNAIKYHNDYATIVITGKGNKQRTIYLNKACLAALSAYMNVRPHDGVKDRNALFLSNRLNRISPKTVQHLVDVYLAKAGLDGLGFSVHKLRHTAATLMYQTGKVDVLELKEILGHENLNTTQIYTHLLESSLKKAVEANPLAEFDVKSDNSDTKE